MVTIAAFVQVCPATRALALTSLVIVIHLGVEALNHFKGVLVRRCHHKSAEEVVDPIHYVPQLFVDHALVRDLSCFDTFGPRVQRERLFSSGDITQRII